MESEEVRANRIRQYLPKDISEGNNAISESNQDHDEEVQLSETDHEPASDWDDRDDDLDIIPKWVKDVEEVDLMDVDEKAESSWPNIVDEVIKSVVSRIGG